MDTEEILESFTATDKQRLVNILGKKELSFYDFKTLVEYIAAAMGRANEKTFHWLNAVSETIESDIETATQQVIGLGDKLYKLQKEIEKKQDESFALIDSEWKNKFKQYKDNFEKCVQETKNLPKIVFPEISIPYNWKEMLDMVDRLSKMNEDQRKVFYELIERFNVK